MCCLLKSYKEIWFSNLWLILIFTQIWGPKFAQSPVSPPFPGAPACHGIWKTVRDFAFSWLTVVSAVPSALGSSNCLNENLVLHAKKIKPYSKNSGGRRSRHPHENNVKLEAFPESFLQPGACSVHLGSIWRLRVGGRNGGLPWRKRAGQKESLQVANLERAVDVTDSYMIFRGV